MNPATKQYLKEHGPVKLLALYRAFANSYPALRHAALKQAKRFERTYSKPSSKGAEQVRARMIFFTHQIEKGLSHMHFRYGFGKRPLASLAKKMKMYRAAVPNYGSSQSYHCALAALHEYVVRHEGHEEALQYVKDLFSEETWHEIQTEQSNLGGSIVISRGSKQNNKNLPFKELSESRHSIREYADQPVTYEELLPAVQLAMRTPTVCNRQPARLHIILNPEIIRKALNYQGGFNGYKLPPALLLVTADNAVFMAPQERNEGFTDGGLFGMSLLLSLEREGLAACPLNTMMKEGPETATRKLLNIPDNENMVMYVAVGHFPDEVKTCVSHRFDAQDIITVVR